MDRQAETTQRKRRDRGFTLIELLIVIAILGVLSTIVVLSVSGINNKSKSVACSADQKTLQTAYEAFIANGGTYTTIAGGGPGQGTNSDVTSQLVPGYLHSAPTSYTVDAGGATHAIALNPNGCA